MKKVPAKKTIPVKAIPTKKSPQKTLPFKKVATSTKTVAPAKKVVAKAPAKKVPVVRQVPESIVINYEKGLVTTGMLALLHMMETFIPSIQSRQDPTGKLSIEIKLEEDHEYERLKGSGKLFPWEEYGRKYAFDIGTICTEFTEG